MELDYKERIAGNQNGRIVALIIMLKNLALTLGHQPMKVYEQGYDRGSVFGLNCAVNVCALREKLKV